jgi:hypothetical protein
MEGLKSAMPMPGCRVGEYFCEFLSSAFSESSSTGPSSQNPMPETVPTKVYDWTYTTTYAGHNTASSSPTTLWHPADAQNPTHAIPLAELTRRDPIMFYAEIPLFEDELHDNGASHLVVRIVGNVAVEKV